ncbi:MAG: hypothetical protein ACYS99_17690 [Planctomycetota bacterium]|jgi:hypothetical protein
MAYQLMMQLTQQMEERGDIEAERRIQQEQFERQYGLEEKKLGADRLREELRKAEREASERGRLQQRVAEKGGNPSAENLLAELARVTREKEEKAEFAKVESAAESDVRRKAETGARGERALLEEAMRSGAPSAIDPYKATHVPVDEYEQAQKLAQQRKDEKTVKAKLEEEKRRAKQMRDAAERSYKEAKDKAKSIEEAREAATKYVRDTLESFRKEGLDLNKAEDWTYIDSYTLELLGEAADRSGQERLAGTIRVMIGRRQSGR